MDHAFGSRSHFRGQSRLSVVLMSQTSTLRFFLPINSRESLHAAHPCAAPRFTHLRSAFRFSSSRFNFYPRNTSHVVPRNSTSSSKTSSTPANPFTRRTPAPPHVSHTCVRLSVFRLLASIFIPAIHPTSFHETVRRHLKHHQLPRIPSTRRIPAPPRVFAFSFGENLALRSCHTPAPPFHASAPPFHAPALGETPPLGHADVPSFRSWRFFYQSTPENPFTRRTPAPPRVFCALIKPFVLCVCAPLSSGNPPCGRTDVPNFHALLFSLSAFFFQSTPASHFTRRTLAPPRVFALSFVRIISFGKSHVLRFCHAPAPSPPALCQLLSDRTNRSGRTLRLLLLPKSHSLFVLF